MPRAFMSMGAVVVVVVGVVAAAIQAGVAVAVAEPVLIAVLATLGAILVVGVGGGLIKPMQARWERLLAAQENEPGQAPVAAPPAAVIADAAPRAAVAVIADGTAAGNGSAGSASAGPVIAGLTLAGPDLDGPGPDGPVRAGPVPARDGRYRM